MSAIIVIPGGARGKGRPRFNPHTGHAHTDQATRAAEARVIVAWQHAGEPDLGDGALAMDLEVVVVRPGSHFRVSGELSAAGLRAPRPLKTPDLDNVLKLVADALNKHAYKDDKQLVEVAARRRWAGPGEREHVRVLLRELVETTAADTTHEAVAA